MSNSQWSAQLTDQLTKVYPDSTDIPPVHSLRGFAGQRNGFQVVLTPPVTWRAAPSATATVQIAAPGSSYALHQVRLVPVQLPCFADHDGGYQRTVPGLFPDLLVPSDGTVRFSHPGAHALWVDLIPGPHAGPVHITVRSDHRTVLDTQLPVTVTPGPLPAAPVTHLTWLHADCLADYYQVPVWSQAHWRSLTGYLSAAAQMGVTGVLTPLWSPPLDTAPGHYRTATQLLDISQDRTGQFTFGTTRLDQWLDLMAQAGLTDVECPHLFTQWGAKATPRVLIDGQWHFGWDTPATHTDYLTFLSQLIPFLRNYLDRAVGAQHTWWHVSDEPPAEEWDSYQRASAVVSGLLAGAQRIDAVSEPDFADLVETPVVATDVAGDFIAKGLAVDWVYHCVAQTRAVANRFIAQPALAHRVLAEQLYLGRAQGFLHWGFNFYSAALSTRPIDPFADTCAGGHFPGGDPFIVYPGPDGQPLPSVRHRVLGSAWQDLATYYLAEQLAGRSAVTAIIDPARNRDYASPWGSAADYLARREAVHTLITRMYQ